MKTQLTLQQEFRKRLLLQVISKKKTTKEAAIEAGLTKRAIQKAIKRYQNSGDISLIHGNVGKVREDLRRNEDRLKIIDIFQNTRVEGENPFEDITYTFFTEILEDSYNIKGSVSWVKSILNSIGYKTPIKHNCRNQKYFLMRDRKEHTGELVQADGTPYDWFKDGHNYCIQGFVDDATGYPVGLYMTKNECLLGYVEAFRNMAETEGIPEQLYPDKAGIFFVNKKTNDKEKHLTQFGLIMENLGVDMFPAHSPQAKGRIERFWQTIQHRLPNLFRLKGIKTVEKANEFLKNDFPKIYKRWFPVNPKSEKTKFVKAEMSEVNKYLKATFSGHCDKSGVFTLKGYRFFCPELPNKKIHIHLNEIEGLWVTDANHSEKKYIPRLVETDTTGTMPEVMKILIDKTFLKNAKPRFREVYFDIDDIVLSQVKPKLKKAV